MSYLRICDICFTPNESTWKFRKFRKRWNIFKWHSCETSHGQDGEWKEKIDMCEKCLSKFKDFVSQKEKKGDV